VVRRLVAATLAAASLVGCGGTGPSVLPQPGSDRGGIGGRAGFAEGFDLLYRSDEELERELDGIVDTGARWLRVDVPWSLVEEKRGEYEWDRVDEVIDAARDRGLKVLGLLAFTPEWARPAGTTDKHPPRRLARFAEFARDAVRRYSARGVHAWEIWNEPNLSYFWEPVPDPEKFAALLAAVAPAIRRADRRATIVTGGLSPAADLANGTQVSPVAFLERVYAAGAQGSFDAVGHHPSNYPHMPLREEANFNENAFAGVTPQLYQVMVENGDATKKIWGTEIGAPTIKKSTPSYVARYLTEAYTAWIDWAFTGPLLWYSYIDAGKSKSFLDHFGLVTPDFEPKEPALDAFTELMRGRPPPSR
jgi:polysaccharide biosynthesis protein PslG